MAAQVEESRGVARGHQHAHPHPAADRVGHLEDLDAAVPEIGQLQHPIELHPHRLGVDSPVEVELDRAQQLGGVPGPVLERRGREVRRRQHQTPVVPGPDHDVGQRDLLDPSPLLLDDHHVVEPDGVAERELDAGEHVAERRLRRNCRHHADQSCRGEEAGSHGLDARQAQQHRAQGDHDGRADDESTDDRHLGAQPPRLQVVRHADVVLAERAVDHEQHPATPPTSRSRRSAAPARSARPSSSRRGRAAPSRAPDRRRPRARGRGTAPASIDAPVRPGATCGRPTASTKRAVRITASAMASAIPAVVSRSVQ